MSELSKLKIQMQYLAGIKDERKTNLNESTTGKNARLLHYKQAKDGVVYGIVQENSKYFIKYSPSLKKDMSVSDFLYIGGKENILKERYETYKECEKKLHSKIVFINESYSKLTSRLIKENEEELPKNSEIDAQKPAETAEVEMDTETPDMGAEEEVTTDTVETPEVDMSSQEDVTTDTVDTPEEENAGSEETPDMGGEETSDMGGEEGGDTEGEIKSLIGKLTAQFQELGEVEPSLAKNAINSIISSTKSGIAQMSDKEKEELQRRIEKDGEKLDENEDEESDVISGAELIKGFDDEEVSYDEEDNDMDDEDMDIEEIDVDDLGLDETLLKEMIISEYKKQKKEKLIESVVRKKVYERYKTLNESKEVKKNEGNLLKKIVKEEYEKLKETESKPKMLSEGILDKVVSMGVKGIAKLGDAVKSNLEKAVSKMLSPSDMQLANDVISKIEKGELNEGINDIFRKLKPAIMLFILLKVGTLIASNPAMAQEADEQLKNFGKAKTEVQYDGGGEDVSIDSMSTSDIQNIVKNIVEKTGLKLKSGYPDYQNEQAQELKKLIDNAKANYDDVQKMNINGKPVYVVMYNGLPYIISDAPDISTKLIIADTDVETTDLPKDLPKIKVIPKYVFEKVVGKIHTSKDASGKKVKHFTGTQPKGTVTGYDISLEK